MKITIDNLGVVRHIEFDTQKPLSLFCGPNSTGKTYVAYVLYAVKDYARFLFSDKQITSRMNIIDLSEKDIKNNLCDIFGVSDKFDEERFRAFNLSISIDDLDNVLVNSTWMLTVERNSIYTFKTELSLSRNSLVDRMLSIKDKSENRILELLHSSARRYPLPIRNDLLIANDLDNIKKIRGEYYDFAINLENTLLHGKVEVSSTGEVEFIVGENINLPIQMSSSIVKTMSSLILYLKYIVKKGDTLIIDEPEMNLHPDNQILLARIFAQMVNMGIKLVISTHSDYIIREFNNLIMANELKLRDNNSWQDYGYTEDMLLNQGKVSVKYFKPNKESDMVDVNDIEVNAYGFAIDSIDDAITLQNDISNEFGNTLNYDYGV